MYKTGVIYMSIPFHSRITRQNRSKNERATPKGSKICFWAWTPKETKIEKSEKNIQRLFDISFKEKKNYSNRTTRSMGFWGYLQGQHINVSVPVYLEV